MFDFRNSSRTISVRPAIFPRELSVFAKVEFFMQIAAGMTLVLNLNQAYTEITKTVVYFNRLSESAFKIV